MGAPLDSKILGGRGDRDDILHRAMFALNGQRPREALRCAEEILKVDPRHGQALRVFGSALLMLDRAADAIAPLEKAARQLRTAEADTLRDLKTHSHLGPDGIQRPYRPNIIRTKSLRRAIEPEKRYFPN